MITARKRGNGAVESGTCVSESPTNKLRWLGRCYLPQLNINVFGGLRISTDSEKGMNRGC